MSAARPDQRFSQRVDAYVRHRPGYPPELMPCLREEFGLSLAHAVADVGSGTGISAELFLDNGNRVFGIEPNAAMRSAAEQRFADRPNFVSVDARAEATTLPDASVDWVVAAQAFHWFDVPAARREFARILRPGGRVALIWNDRRNDTPFLRDYESLLRAYGTDYLEVCHQGEAARGRVAEFFEGRVVHRRVFPNAQHFDFDGLRGRLESSSYVPRAGDARYEPMIAELRRLFDRNVAGGTVQFGYDACLFIGERESRDPETLRHCEPRP